MELLEEDGVEVDERRFKSSIGIDGLSQPFVSGRNILINATRLTPFFFQFSGS